MRRSHPTTLCRGPDAEARLRAGAVATLRRMQYLQVAADVVEPTSERAEVLWRAEVWRDAQARVLRQLSQLLAHPYFVEPVRSLRKHEAGGPER